MKYFHTTIATLVNVTLALLILPKEYKKFSRGRSVRKLLGKKDIVVHIPTRVPDEVLGERRLKPVVAMEDYKTFEKVRKMLVESGCRVSLNYIPPRSESNKLFGRLELVRGSANIVICGPRNSLTIEEYFANLDGLKFEKSEDGWYFERTDTGEVFKSTLDDSHCQYAFLGKARYNEIPFLLICGISAIGSDGVAYFLSDPEQLDVLLKEVGDDEFYRIIQSSYHTETKEVYDAKIVR